MGVELVDVVEALPALGLSALVEPHWGPIEDKVEEFVIEIFFVDEAFLLHLLW